MEIAILHIQKNKNTLLKKYKSSCPECEIYNPLLGELLETRNCAFNSVTFLITSRVLLFISSYKECDILSSIAFLVYIIGVT